MYIHIRPAIYKSHKTYKSHVNVKDGLEYLLLLQHLKCLVAFIREFFSAWADGEQETILQNKRDVLQ